jgi:excisionase family DNA binding protein
MAGSAEAGVKGRREQHHPSDKLPLSGCISAREAAAALGLSERTIRRAIRRGELVASKEGRAFRIHPEQLDRYRARRGISIDNRSTDAGGGRASEASAAALLIALPRAERARLVLLPAPLTRFFGREREVAQVAALLHEEDVRLVTLNGPGGVGKTRLALRVAEETSEDFADGVAFVSLAPVRSAEFVLPTIMQALGVRQVESQPAAARLLTFLQHREFLLVLDNFEQVTTAGPALSDLLLACRHLTILVTSRSPLHLSGERLVVVPPLPLPKRRATPDGAFGLPPPDELAACEAIQLFVDRAQTASADFTLNTENAAAVTAVCERTDGLPLAIELAAARTRVLSPADLLARLSHRLTLLRGGPRDQPPRLRSMSEAIAWSYDLLGPEARALFRRLAVFVGGFTLEAAEEVIGAQGDSVSGWQGDRESVLPTIRSPHDPITLDLLTTLVDESLLQRGIADDDQTRYTMLETVREYGLERLAASGDDAATREAHAAHYLALAEAAASDAGGAGDGSWMRRLAAERPNLRAALDWLEQTGRADAVLQMSGALWHYWYRLGELAEGRTRLERALAAAPPDVDPTLRARVLRGAGVLAWQSADYDVSRNRLEAALVAYRALGDQVGIAWVLNSLGCLFATLTAKEKAEAYMTEALAIFGELDDAVGMANLTSNLGELAEAEGDHELAIARLEDGLAMWRALGDRVGAVRALVFLGQALLAQADAVRADAVLREALAAINEIDYKQILPAALRAFAHLAMRRGDCTAAARWYGAADGVMADLGMELSAARRAEYERTVTVVRETLGETAFATVWAAGRGLSAAQAIADVLAHPRTRPLDSSTLNASRLSPRERDVLRLMAAGRSDKQIADLLFITRRTASKHVSAILAKLAVDSRTAAVAAAIHLGLS